MRKTITIAGSLALVLLLLAFERSNNTRFNTLTDDTSVATLLKDLGAALPDHAVRTTAGTKATADVGRQLVLEGIAKLPGGGKSAKQSSHFVCTSCHNIQKEDPDLRVSDPEARLNYAVQKGLPFLPGTTLYGVVNRTKFYNDDYEKKYGDLVKSARSDLRAAIQLCATECAQGRALEDWEMEAVMAYLWTIELKLGDLDLSNTERTQIANALQNGGSKADAAKLLQSAFLDHSPAHFLTPPPDRNAGYGLPGNAQRGSQVYELSCLHCHGERRYSFFNLDASKYSLQFLDQHMPRYTRYSTYQVVRYGTSPMNGKRAYMPHYTQERMSNQQVEDLRAYLSGQ